jgi:CRISPR-associated protein Csb2
MLVVTLSFPAGRYHATSWGRHVNEANPEWPPSATAWSVRSSTRKRKKADIPQDRVESLFRALCNTEPCYSLPPATASHTRSFLSSNERDPSARSLIFDGFVVVEREHPVLMGWPDLELTAQQLADLSTLLEVLNYLGVRSPGGGDLLSEPGR